MFDVRFSNIIGECSFYKVRFVKKKKKEKKIEKLRNGSKRVFNDGYRKTIFKMQGNSCDDNTRSER